MTVAAVATDEAETLPSVARVATVTVASPEVQRPEASNDADPGTGSDPDRWCWPHSPAMNSREIDTFTDRLALFTGKGLTLEDGERLADKLAIRDRESDNRRLCLECAHLHGAGRWRCGNWRAADVPAQGVARDLVLMLHRCSGFRPVKAGV